jgi:hypothetical protein
MIIRFDVNHSDLLRNFMLLLPTLVIYYYRFIQIFPLNHLNIEIVLNNSKNTVSGM